MSREQHAKRKAKPPSGFDSERIFVSTATIVPQDRRGTSRGGYALLRKPKGGAAPSGEVLSFGHMTLGSSLEMPHANPKMDAAPASARGPLKEERGGEVKWRYDPMLQSWFQVLRPHTTSQLKPESSPRKLTLADYRMNNTARSAESAQLSPRKRKSLSVTFSEALPQRRDVQELPWPSQRSVISDNYEQREAWQKEEWRLSHSGTLAAPPVEGVEYDAQVANGDWQAFRSPKPPAFRVAPVRILLKDAIGRELTHLMAETPQNLLVQNNALYHSNAQRVEAERPLSAYSPRAASQKKTVPKPPPPKGRRNCSSQEFLGSMSHDFVPVHNQTNIIPSTDGTGYAMWTAACASTGERIMPTQVQQLPTKQYGGHMHPGLYEEKIARWQGPLDKGRLNKANVDVLGMLPNLRPVSSYHH